jgi:MFS family permease
VLPKVKANWALSKTEEGAIASIFTVGFMCTSPMWAHFGLRYRINVNFKHNALTIILQKVITLGLVIFAIAALLGGLLLTYSRGSQQKFGYYLFTVTRALVGAGESAMISLGYTIVDQLSPPKYKTMYMAAIMMSPPLGIAVGYGVSGLIVSISQWWQFVFLAEAAIVMACAFLCYHVPFHGYKIKESDALISKNQVDEVIPVSLSLDVNLTAINNDVLSETSPTEATSLTKVFIFLNYTHTHI